jgi:hypothetical protein
MTGVAAVKIRGGEGGGGKIRQVEKASIGGVDAVGRRRGCRVGPPGATEAPENVVLVLARYSGDGFDVVIRATAIAQDASTQAQAGRILESHRLKAA